MGNKLADLLVDSEIADAKRLAGQREAAYQAGYQAGALAMREAAAKVAHGMAEQSERSLKKAAAAGREYVASHRQSDIETASTIELRIRSIDPAALKGE